MRFRAGLGVLLGLGLCGLPLRAAAAGKASDDSSAYTDSASNDSSADATTDEQDTVDARPKRKAPPAESGLLKIKLFNDAAGRLSMDGEDIGKIQANVDEPYVIRGVSRGRHRLKLVTEEGKAVVHEVVMHAGHNKVVRILSAESDGAGEEAATVPVQRGKRHAVPESARQPERSYEGAKTACTILDWTGWGFFIVGMAYGITGLQDEENGKGKYLSHPGWASDGNYYGYEIDGKYYTADEYATYTKGEGEVATGAVCLGIGCVCWIVEMCIPTHPRNQQGSLMDIRDKQLAFAVPDISYDPRRDKVQATLLSAEF